MLTFTRNPGQSVRFGELGEIQLSILHVSPGQVKIGITAPKSVSIRRSELPSKSEKPEKEMHSED